MRRPHSIPAGSDGMALPMVLWAIALLMAITLLLAGVINGWIAEETHSGKEFRARLQALSGVAVAMAVQPGDPLLTHGDKNEGWSVVIGDESGRINPNYFLGHHPDQRSVLRDLFAHWKLSPQDAESAADGLYDWQSPSPFKSLRGAKKAEYDALGYSGLPAGAPFLSPEEMGLVIGFGPVMKAQPKWRRYFSTYNPGQVNLMHAPLWVLTDFLGFTPAQADAWIKYRNGKDGIEGTEDDNTPATLPTALSLAGINPSGAQGQLIQFQTTITGSVRRIESTGYCGGVSRRIVVVISGGSGNNSQTPSSVLGWSEE